MFARCSATNYYIVHFQKPGVADAGLAQRRAPRVHAARCARGVPIEQLASRPCAHGRQDRATWSRSSRATQGLGEPLLTDDELAVYVATFARTGFTGGINWYRNLDRNWEHTAHLDGARIEVPSLMVTAELDPVLRPEMAARHDALRPDLETVMIPDCGHWTQQEKPAELNQIMVEWLRRRHRAR